jgi:hypothetical protein
VIDADLRARLLAWEAEDDARRAELAQRGELSGGYHPEMEAVHRENARRLAEVVEARGWPGASLVGEDGARAAWRICQHAIGEPAKMRAWLPLVRDTAARGDASAADVAMLEDRIRTFEGRPQRYGTQYDWNDAGDAMELTGGVEEPETVDERRRAVGLPPIVWRRAVPGDETPPTDLAAYRREFAVWAKRVGWRP